VSFDRGVELEFLAFTLLFRDDEFGSLS